MCPKIDVAPTVSGHQTVFAGELFQSKFSVKVVLNDISSELQSKKAVQKFQFELSAHHCSGREKSAYIAHVGSALSRNT